MRVFIFVLMMFIGVSSLSAKRKKKSGRTVNSEKVSYLVGGLISAKGTINTGTNDGFKNKPAFGMGDLGGSASILFGKVGFVINLMYSTGAVSWYPYNDDSAVLTDSYNYFVFNPNIYLGGFIIGANFGSPLGFTRTAPDGEEYEGDVDGMETLKELIIGGMIPLIDNKKTRLNLDIRAGYVWADLGEEIFPASLSLGLSYYFKIKM